MLIQEVVVDAVQLHPAWAVTATLSAPPFPPGVAVVGDTPNVQGAPAWVTVTVCPATVNVPVRLVVAVFAATV
jgi:hypothetical protein